MTFTIYSSIKYDDIVVIYCYFSHVSFLPLAVGIVIILIFSLLYELLICVYTSFYHASQTYQDVNCYNTICVNRLLFCIHTHLHNLL